MWWWFRKHPLTDTMSTDPSHPPLQVLPPPLPILGSEEKWVLYDGPCVLCNATVSWLRKHDRRGVLQYAPHPNPEADAVAYWNGLRWYHAHEALSPILRELATPYPYLAQLLSLVPDWILKKMYRWIAAHRYTWFGKNDALTACPIPHSSSEPQYHSC